MSFKEFIAIDGNYNALLREVERYIPKEDAPDVLHEIVTQMLSENVPRNDYMAYAVSACWRSYHSKTSPYARKYGKNIITTELDGRENIPDEKDELDSVDILKMIDSCPEVVWWCKEAVKRKILEEKTFKELAEEYDCTENQIVYSYYTTIRKIREYYGI